MRKLSQASHTHRAQGQNPSNRPNGIKGTGRLMDPAYTMILLGKFTIETEFFEIFESRVHDILPYLLEGAAYTAVDLIGENLWTEITTLGQRQAVLSLKHMAALPGSQLTVAPWSDGGTTYFQIASGQGAQADSTTGVTAQFSTARSPANNGRWAP